MWHLVEGRWYCNCNECPELCRTVVYVQDVRILRAELDSLRRTVSDRSDRVALKEVE